MPSPMGILFSESALSSPFVSVLAAFVAVNTVIYATLAIAKLVPAIHIGELIPGRRRRCETRSIFVNSERTFGDREPKRTHITESSREV